MPKILIIDDEADLIEIIADELTEHTIFQAANGKEGLESALKNNPDLIISDINMPQMDGLKMLEQLRINGFSEPVILITAFTDTNKIREAWRLGAFDFLDKPIAMDKLHSAVKKAFKFGVQFNESRTQNAEESLSLQLQLQKNVLEKISTLASTEKLTLFDWFKKIIKRQTDA